MIKRTKTIIEYVADDDTIFKSEKECLKYEKKKHFEKEKIALNGRSVYVVVPLGFRKDIEIFSTRELAEKAQQSIPSNDRGIINYFIVEEILDERFWNEKK